MKKNTLIALAVVIVLLLVGAWWAFKKPGSQTEVLAPGGGEEQSGVQGETGTGAPSGDTSGGENQVEENAVTYADSGFSPSTLTIKAGDTVVFKNESSSAFWPASAVHPIHRVYSGTSLDEHCPDTAGAAFDACTGIQPGNSWSFTFNKTGTWRYHNHLNASHIGTIVVE